MYLRVVLKINPLSPSWLFNASWGKRVGDWLDSFTGYGWAPACSLTLSPTRAVVYLQPVTGAPVTDRQLANLSREWSDRVGGVSVESIETRGGCDNPDADSASINKGLFNGTVEAVGSLLGDAGRAFAVPLTIALLGTGIYLAIRYTRKGGA